MGGGGGHLESERVKWKVLVSTTGLRNTTGSMNKIGMGGGGGRGHIMRNVPPGFFRVKGKKLCLYQQDPGNIGKGVGKAHDL